MKLKYKLDKEEQWIEDHADEFKPLRGAERRKIDKMFERARKKKVMTIRVNDDDITTIKVIALKQGLPYQTLISSVLHKYADNQLQEKDESKNYGRKRKNK
jgi:predicted DNA binding CopG/RHH family protein